MCNFRVLFFFFVRNFRVHPNTSLGTFGNAFGSYAESTRVGLMNLHMGVYVIEDPRGFAGISGLWAVILRGYGKWQPNIP